MLNIEVISHRGIGFGDENTAEAYNNAGAAGFTVEGDVRAARDALVMLHDDTLDRTTNGTGLLRDKRYEDIKHLSAGKKHTHVEIPRLEDILDPQKRWILDIKENIGGQVVDLVIASDSLEQVRFSVLDLAVLQDIKGREPRAQVGYVTETTTPNQIPALAEAGVDYLSPWIDITSNELVSACHDNGMRVFPWIPGDELIWTPAMSDAVDRMIDYGVDGLIVNHAPQVLDAIKRRAQPTATIPQQQTQAA